MSDRAWHPAAGIFPLMGDEELRALADDIAENGQRQAILLDSDGAVIDGRNRERACELAGVEPRYETVDLNGTDPVAFSVSLNVKRRNLSAGQRAIAAAEAYDLDAGPRVGPGEKWYRAYARGFGVSANYVQQARALIERDQAGADAVKAGAAALADAYEELRERERRQEGRTVKIERLRSRRPDLAERMDAGTLALDEAIDLADADARRERDQAATHADLLARAVRALRDDPENASPLLERLVEHEAEITFTASDCRNASAFLVALATGMEQQ